ncbi:hypothetical protein L9F63_018275 [Diploptera punctata]|uniref:Uncharacterized protein n=1 Tax=Diploptera punctata TaxID=6984 RepID=A0AAD7ZWU0_DIPPU|nr:hypothetical protein L9F63_018275 [Diploptera punctata]
MLRNKSLLESVSFTRVPNVATIIRQMCRSNGNLKHLAVKFCTNHNEVIPEDVFRNVLSSCPNLIVLNLKGTNFYTRRFCYELKLLRHLRSIDLRMNRFLSVQDVFAIAQSCTNIQELKLSQCNSKFTDQDAVSLFDSLKKTIRSLKLDLRSLGPPAVLAIFDCTKLTKLYLFCAYSLSGELFRSLAKQLTNLSHLKICNGCKLTCEDFCFVFTNYREQLKHLVHVDVSGCWRLEDSGLKAMADTCSVNLQYLSVKSCKLITGAGVEYTIARCPNILHLNLAHVDKLDELCLNKIPSALPRLRRLVLDKCSNRYQMLTALRESILDLEVKESLCEYSKQERAFL